MFEGLYLRRCNSPCADECNRPCKYHGHDIASHDSSDTVFSRIGIENNTLFLFEDCPEEGLTRSFRQACGIISVLLTPNFVAGHPGRVLF